MQQVLLIITVAVIERRKGEVSSFTYGRSFLLHVIIVFFFMVLIFKRMLDHWDVQTEMILDLGDKIK